ncbi:MAG: uroporphyrinogen-III synthase [Candidatus Tectimicrobiota bacterium]
MSDLQGKRIALLEGRMHSELADLVRRHGGEPYSVPALREVPRENLAEVSRFLDRLHSGALPIVIWLTGVGVMTLCREADRLGRLAMLVQDVQPLTVVCRGPKPVAACKRQGMPVSVQIPSPYTTAELLDTLASIDLAARGVGLVHYGERNAPLADALRARGAHLEELCLYEWRLPEDLGQLQQLVRDLTAGSVDAIAFTSQVQIRHLWQVAAGLGLDTTLARQLTEHCIVTAVGPTCAAALAAVGVTPHVVPSHPKMGPMVMALASYLAAADRV